MFVASQHALHKSAADSGADGNSAKTSHRRRIEVWQELYGHPIYAKAHCYRSNFCPLLKTATTSDKAAKVNPSTGLVSTSIRARMVYFTGLTVHIMESMYIWRDGDSSKTIAGLLNIRNVGKRFVQDLVLSVSNCHDFIWHASLTSAPSLRPWSAWPRYFFSDFSNTALPELTAASEP